MPQWSEYSTGQRIKVLRGRDLTQEQLAQACGVSVETIRKAERDTALSLPTLLKLSAALHADTSVILGQQAPKRATTHQDRMMLRALSQAVHDTAQGTWPETAEPVEIAELRQTVGRAWQLYWDGKYLELGLVLPHLLADAAVTVHSRAAGAEEPALALLSDGYQIAGCTANILGSRDLAYAAVGHAKKAAESSGDPLRAARVESARAWVHLRDARLETSLDIAQRAAGAIEPSFSQGSPEALTVYGNLINHCAVASARQGDAERAGDFLSQGHAAGARLGRECHFHGAIWGPQSAATQAVGINVAVGRIGQALHLAGSVEETGGLAPMPRYRYAMDVALAQAEARQWDAALDTLEGTLRAAPEWARHQVLPGVILEKIGAASTSRLRRVAELLSVSAVPHGTVSA